MKNTLRIFSTLVIIILLSQSCTKKLDLLPTNQPLADSAFNTPAGYKDNFAKLYASMAINSDIPGEIVSDGGNRGFLRMLWYLQCLPTDEAVWNYSDITDPIGIHQMAWSSSTEVIAGLYYRCLFNITLCNNFLNESTEENLSKRKIAGNDADQIRNYRVEARFLRAYLFSILLDEFGKAPFAQESSILTGQPPVEIQRTALFNYIETELKDIEGSLPSPRSNVYGRADKAAAWALLSRLYLNAGVYTGTPRYSEAITYSKKIINSGYSLHSNYKELMLADNHLNTDEFIWTINYDGTFTQTYSGTTFLVHAPAIGGSLTQPLGSEQKFKDSTGLDGSWNCIRITEDFVDKFNEKDIRGQFWTLGMSKSVDTLLGAPSKGYSSTKFRNKTRTGQVAPNVDKEKKFADIDFPVFRLAEVYLNYAEAVLRGGTGGDNATALNYLKSLAIRARPNDPGAALSAKMDLSYVLDERGRELFWECLRRTDLIRYNQFTTGAYLWDWKGGVRNGTAVDPKYSLYPIPATDLSANPNLTQNVGY